MGMCLLVHSSTGLTLAVSPWRLPPRTAPPQFQFTPSGSHCYDCTSASNRDSEKGCLWTQPFLRSPVLHLGNQGAGTASELCCPLCHDPSPLLVPAQGRAQQIDHCPLSLRPCSHSQASQSSLPQNLRLFLSQARASRLFLFATCIKRSTMSVCLSPLILGSTGEQRNKGRSNG